MTATVTTLVTRALDVDFDATLRTADAGRFVRSAIGKLFRGTNTLRGAYSEQFNTVVGVPTFQPADTTIQGIKIDRVVYTDTGAELDQVTRADMLVLQAQPISRGRPEVWAPIATTAVTSGSPLLELWRTPDRVYPLMVIGSKTTKPADLEDADNVPLDDDFEDLPVYYARWQLSLLEDDDVGAARWEKRWTDGWRELRQLTQGKTANRQVPGTWAGARTAQPTFHSPSGTF